MNKTKIVKYLDDNGFKHSIKGFDYLITAIDLCVEVPEKLHEVCKLYAEVGKIHSTTQPRTERAIRHSIETSDVKKITNSEFIARARDHFIYEEET